MTTLTKTDTRERNRQYQERYRKRHPGRWKGWYRANFKRIITRQRVRMVERSRWLAGFKLMKGCSDCGYKASPHALEFDHVNGDKVANVSEMGSCNPAKIWAEVQKCAVRCSNCHMVKTRGRENGYASCIK